MLLRDLLRTGQLTLESLEKDYAVKATRHSTYSNLVLLKYSQIDSPMGEEIVQYCRGIILDEKQNWSVVSWGYNKFFNYGQGHAAEIDWPSARIYEKLDGSLIGLWFYDHQWHVSTSGSPDASGDVHGSDKTFKELFWETWNELGYRLPICPDHAMCFMFELMTPDNRVIVPHDKPRIVLHGARMIMEPFFEFTPEEIAGDYEWECVKTYPMKTLDHAINAAKMLNPMETEGYVVVDKDFHRIKVKSPQYVALHHIKGEFCSDRRILEIVQANESQEWLTYFPEYQAIYDKIFEAYYHHIAAVEELYDAHKDIESHKNFALKIKASPFASALFAVRRQYCTDIETWFRNCDSRKLLRLIGLG